MDAQGLPKEGGCRCGRVRFRITAAPLLTLACHCTGCQRMSSSAFALSAAIPAEGFSVIAGEPVIGGLHGPDAHHYFCPHCMSWMFTKPEGMDFFVNVRTTLLDDQSWTAPFIDIFTKEKLPWVTTPAVHSFADVPTMEGYQALVAEYQSQPRS